MYIHTQHASSGLRTVGNTHPACLFRAENSGIHTQHASSGLRTGCICPLLPARYHGRYVASLSAHVQVYHGRYSPPYVPGCTMVGIALPMYPGCTMVVYTSLYIAYPIPPWVYHHPQPLPGVVTAEHAVCRWVREEALGSNL